MKEGTFPGFSPGRPPDRSEVSILTRMGDKIVESTNLGLFLLPLGRPIRRTDASLVGLCWGKEISFSNDQQTLPSDSSRYFTSAEPRLVQRQG